jgi:exosortase N
MLIFCFLVPVKSFLFFALFFSLFAWVERYRGKVGFMGLSALLIASPIFTYGAGIFSFPLRMQLASWVAGLLGSLQKGSFARGNSIFHGGQEFSVDPACMGLHMLSLSLLMGILFLGLLERKTGKHLSTVACICYLSTVFLLNLCSNLLRILMLVVFHIMPGKAMQDILGILCLIVYVLLPTAWLARKMINRYAQPPGIVPVTVLKHSSAWMVLLSIALVFAVCTVRMNDTYSRFTARYSVNLPGYTTSVFTPGVLKMESDHSLVYIKFLRGFYDTEHHPTMCWGGSGYTFRATRKEKIGGVEVYTAELLKGKEKLYTAWWYSNGRMVTTDQWTWRLAQFRTRKDFAVVNVTTGEKEQLKEEVKALMERKAFGEIISGAD